MKYELYLASESPRRRELLAQAGYKFHVDSVKVSEIINENLNLREAIQALAGQKAEALVDARKHLKLGMNLILSADTMVVLQGRPLGKPHNLQQAEEFLDLLSGKTHSVITGFCLWALDSGVKLLDSDETLVEFHSLSPADIKSYLATGESMDKAGAYAIQGEGRRLVKSYRGSWSNVVGLPLEKIGKAFEAHDWNIDRN
jgi:septum formation protein